MVSRNQLCWRLTQASFTSLSTREMAKSLVEGAQGDSLPTFSVSASLLVHPLLGGSGSKLRVWVRHLVASEKAIRGPVVSSGTGVGKTGYPWVVTVPELKHQCLLTAFKFKQRSLKRRKRTGDIYKWWLLALFSLNAWCTNEKQNPWRKKKGRV